MLWSIVAAVSVFILPGVARGAGINYTTSPSATVKNGTYVGKYVPEWEQDQFLGIPFAIPPVGPFRFARPKSLDSSFTGTRNATQYGYSCYQYSNPNFTLSEDCLTLNGMIQILIFLTLVLICIIKVVRPAGTKPNAKLPVLVWVYGGGLNAGSTADPQYNISGIAHVGQEIKKPVIVGTYICHPLKLNSLIDLDSFNELPTWSLGIPSNSSIISRRKLQCGTSWSAPRLPLD